MLKNLGKLKELYTQLLNGISNYENEINPFFIQVGKKFDAAPKRIIFVGKSVNGWITPERDVEKLFDSNSPDRIVNRHDQMEWVNNLEGPNDVYNTRKSAFWRVIKNTVIEFFGKDDWYNYIAWSNLYKIAPSDGGNPGITLQEIQREHCISILNEEIRLLKPDFVVFLTSYWEGFYLDAIGFDKKKNKSVTWSGYATEFQKVGDITYILSHHPQAKPEEEHVEALLNILR